MSLGACGSLDKANLRPRWLKDHDTDVVDESPPAQNTWYKVFDAEDVRLLWCVFQQDNDDVAAKVVEVRWTIDGNVYFGNVSIASGTIRGVNRDHEASAGGTAGLEIGGATRNAALTVDKRGLSFKVEVRTTSVPGTNQRLRCWCVRETQEIT